MWQFTVLVFMFAPPSPLGEKYVSSTSPPPAPAPSPSRDNSGRLASNGRNPRRRPVRNGNMMSSKPCILNVYTEFEFLHHSFNYTQNDEITQGASCPVIFSEASLIWDGFYRFCFQGDGSRFYFILVLSLLSHFLFERNASQCYQWNWA